MEMVAFCKSRSSEIIPNKKGLSGLKLNQPMINQIKHIAVCAFVGVALSSNAAIVTVDPGSLTLGYMNWAPTAYTLANFPGGGGTGGSPWGLADLQASFSGSQLTLAPNINAYATGNAYWTNPDGTGANQMDASIYAETTGTYVSTTLTFTFDVFANTLVSPYTSTAFIKEFAPDYSSFTVSSVALTPGIGSVSLAISGNAADHVQWGFETFGPDANPSGAGALGSVIVNPAAVPEPTTLALAGIGGAALLTMIRRRSRK